MSHYKMFSVITSTVIFDTDDTDPEWAVMLMAVIKKYVATKGMLILILTTILCLMFIIRTDAEKETSATKGNRGIFILAAAFVIIAPKFMSGIIIKGVSFGGIVFYLVLGAAWSGISVMFTREEG